MRDNEVNTSIFAPQAPSTASGPPPSRREAFVSASPPTNQNLKDAKCNKNSPIEMMGLNLCLFCELLACLFDSNGGSNMSSQQPAVVAKPLGEVVNSLR